MQEFEPLVLGGLAAAATTGAGSLRTRMLVVAAMGIVVGVAVSSMTGELADSPLFALWDSTQFLLSAAISAAAAAFLRDRRGPPPARRRT